jgi:hypothetical protein
VIVCGLAPTCQASHGECAALFPRTLCVDAPLHILAHLQNYPPCDVMTPPPSLPPSRVFSFLFAFFIFRLLNSISLLSLIVHSQHNVHIRLC